MTRNHRSAKAAGSRFERTVADYLAAALEDDRIDRRVKTGAKDRGDVSGMRAHGRRLVIECKDTTRTCLAEWIAEADTEARNDDALVGITVHKRKGVGDPGRQWVTMTVDDLLACLYGQRFGHRGPVPHPTPKSRSEAISAPGMCPCGCAEEWLDGHGWVCLHCQDDP